MKWEPMRAILLIHKENFLWELRWKVKKFGWLWCICPGTTRGLSAKDKSPLGCASCWCGIDIWVHWIFFAMVLQLFLSSRIRASIKTQHLYRQNCWDAESIKNLVCSLEGKLSFWKLSFCFFFLQGQADESRQSHKTQWFPRNILAENFHTQK